MMYGFAMANPPQPTVKIGHDMSCPYDTLIFCDENRQNNPVHGVLVVQTGGSTPAEGQAHDRFDLIYRTFHPSITCVVE